MRIKLFASRDPTSSWCESTHISQVKAMLRKAGIASDAQTHVTRGSGCRMIEIAGVPEDQIRRLGHWASGAMEKYYLSALPRDGMRAVAGIANFREKRRHYIERALVEPPESLQIQIFPQVERWLFRHQRGQACEQTLSCLGFLNLLKKLRPVILQDSVVLMQKYPNLFIWNHHIFCTEAYRTFSSDLLAAMETTEHPLALSLEHAMPDMVNEVASVKRSLTAEINVANAKIQRLESKLERMEQKLDR